MKKFQINNLMCLVTCLIFLTGISVPVAAKQDDRSIRRMGQSKERRIALVIGNSAYKQSPLKNPVNDAGDIAAALEKNGFQVNLLRNGDKRQMEDAIRAFGKRLYGGGVGLFYFAGHGIQHRGRNYLVPVKARIEDESDVKYEAVDAGKVLGKMELAGNEVNIVILDACRNNPYSRSFRSTKQGLAQMDSPTGSLLAYATSPGSVAADGKGRNGVYTKYLLKYMGQPGQSINKLFMKVRRSVLEETGQKQTPWESSSLTGNFYFGGGSMPVDRPDPQPNQSIGSLLVKSEPSGAEIYVDGYYEGKAPLTLKQLETGGVSVRATWKGYGDTEKKVRIRSGRRTELTLVLGRKISSQQSAASHQPSRTFTDSLTGMAFVYIKPGTFKMGSPEDEEGRSDYEDLHEVTLTKGFYLQTTEVTQGQWKEVMGTNPSEFKTCGNNCPVEQVSWNDVQKFIKRLNQKEGIKKYHLPTEAEWEYAARAGSNSAFARGDSGLSYDINLNNIGWYRGNSLNKTHRTAQKQPNAWGLYDMHGNVWEWCQDWLGLYPSGSVIDPKGASGGRKRIIRGGAIFSGPDSCRSASRLSTRPGDRRAFIGFRLARTL